MASPTSPSTLRHVFAALRGGLRIGLRDRRTVVFGGLATLSWSVASIGGVFAADLPKWSRYPLETLGYLAFGAVVLFVPCLLASHWATTAYSFAVTGISQPMEDRIRDHEFVLTRTMLVALAVPAAVAGPLHSIFIDLLEPVFAALATVAVIGAAVGSLCGLVPRLVGWPPPRRTFRPEPVPPTPPGVRILLGMMTGTALALLFPVYAILAIQGPPLIPVVGLPLAFLLGGWIVGTTVWLTSPPPEAFARAVQETR